ncbi:MAG: sialate O-acetylesterase [Planctomycetes bacterium]|nr:sialate O-acetylesterase [Planctomycetota bacterium]
MIRSLMLSAAMCFGALAAAQDITVAGIFTDGMVLPRDRTFPVWGTGSAGVTITVALAGKTVTATTGADGQWKAVLGPLAAGGPHELTITGAKTITCANVLIGDVWLCAGQSNMEFALRFSATAEADVPAAKHPQIRLFTVTPTFSATPGADVPKDAPWQECTPETARHFSAVGYYFGKHLHEKLKIPIGLIDASWGGTPAEAWTSEAGLAACPEFAPVIAAVRAPAATPAPAKFDQNAPTVLFNAMIEPLVPFGIRGVIWYQGEANSYRAFQYRTLFPALIRDWRTQWAQGDFPFLFVQLANFTAPQKRSGDSHWAELREAQLMTLSLPKTGMAVAVDIGEEKDVHPRNKAEVGRRLGLAAMAVEYGEKSVYSGPIFSKQTIEGCTIRLRFDHIGDGLVAKGGEPIKHVAIAGEDRKFVWATATISGDEVIVSSPEVPKPVAVRYDWAENPDGNLYNREGLPASPFRTDDWPGITKPKP